MASFRCALWHRSLSSSLFEFRNKIELVNEQPKTLSNSQQLRAKPKRGSLSSSPQSLPAILIFNHEQTS